MELRRMLSTYAQVKACNETCMRKDVGMVCKFQILSPPLPRAGCLDQKHQPHLGTC